MLESEQSRIIGCKVSWGDNNYPDPESANAAYIARLLSLEIAVELQELRRKSLQYLIVKAPTSDLSKAFSLLADQVLQRSAHFDSAERLGRTAQDYVRQPLMPSQTTSEYGRFVAEMFRESTRKLAGSMLQRLMRLHSAQSNCEIVQFQIGGEPRLRIGNRLPDLQADLD